VISSNVIFMSGFVSSSNNLVVGSHGVAIDAQFNDGILDLVIFNFGNLTNLRDDVQNPQTTLAVSVMALVINSGINVQGVTLGAAASFAQTRRSQPYRDLLGPIGVVEPLMSLGMLIVDGISKVREAGDTVPVQLSVQHIRPPSANISYSPSFAVTVREFFNQNFLLQVASPSLSSNYPLQAGVNTIVSGSHAGDTSAVISISNMPLVTDSSEDLAINLVGIVSNSAVIGETVSDSSSLVYYSSPPYQGVQYGRNYTASSSITFSLLDTSSMQHILASTSVSQIPVNQASIGEILTFQVSITLPKGLSLGVVVAEDLAPPEYRGGRLQLVSAVVSSMPTNIVASTGLQTGSSGAIADKSFSDGINDFVTFNFGNVTNFFNNTAPTNSTIVMTIVAEVIDNPVNNVQGTVLGAAATFNETLRSTPIRNVTPGMTIEEPLLSLNVVIVGQNTTIWHGGENVSIIATIKHVKTGSPQSHSPAFSVRITDLFGNGLYLVPGTVSISSNYPLQPGLNSITSGNGQTDTGMIVDIFMLPLVGDNSADLTINVIGVINKDVLIVSTVENLVSLQYDSVPTGGRSYSDSEEDSIFVADTSFFEHTIATTTIPQLPTSQASIGEFITLLINISLPEGVTEGVVISEDLAPPEFQQGRLQVISSNVIFMSGFVSSSTNLIVGSHGVAIDAQFNDGILDLVIFNFGNLTNLRDDVQNPQNTVVLQIVALVVNVFENVQDVQVSAAASYAETRRSQPYRDLLSPLSIQEPNVTVSLQTTNGAIIDRSGGDTVPFLITVAHQRSPSPFLSHSPAFALAFSDPFDPDLLLEPGTVTLSANYPVGGGTVIVSGDGPSDTSVLVDLAAFWLGTNSSADLLVKVSGMVSPYVVVGTTVANPVGITYSSSPPYNGIQHGRNYTALAMTTFPIRDSSVLTESFVYTSLPYTPVSPQVQVNIGETVTYTATATVPAGTLENVVIAHSFLPPDQPGKLELHSASITLGPLTTSNEGVISGASPVVSTVNGVKAVGTYYLGNLTIAPVVGTVHSTDTITMVFTALVLNEPANVAGTPFTIATTFSDEWQTQRLLVPTFTLIEPALSVTKTQSVGSGDGGDTVYFSITIAHTAASSSVAFNVKVVDAGNTFLPVVPRSMVLTNAISATVLAGNSSGDTSLNLVINEMPLQAGPVVISYACMVSAQAVANTLLTTQTSISYTSAIDPLLSRFGSAITSVLNFNTFDVALSSFQVNSTSLGQQNKVLTSSSIPGIAVGETATLRTIVLIPEGITTNLLLTLSLPTGLQAVSSSIYSMGHMTSLLSVGSPGIPAGPNQVEFVFGTVTNTPNGVVNENDQLIADVVVVAIDQPTFVTNGIDFTPNVSITYNTIGNQVKTLSASVEVVEPHLLVQVMGNVSTIGLDEILYTVVVRPAPDSTAPAYSLVIKDLISDSALSLVAGTVTTTAGTIVYGNNAADTTVQITLSSVLPNSAPITIQFLTSVNSTYDPANPIGNTATAQYNALPSGTGRSYLASGTFSTPLDWPQLDSFVIAATSVVNTGQNSSFAAVAIGETVTLQMTFTVPLQIKQVVPITATINTLPNFVGSATPILQVLSSSVGYITPGVSTLLAVGSPGAAIDTNGDGIGDGVVFSFGVPTYNTTIDGNYEFQVIL